MRSEEHTSELQSRRDLVCRLLLEASGDTLDLTSFPTRRSSDLQERGHRQDRWFLVRPLPGGSIRPVCAVLVGIISARYLFVKEFLFCVGTDTLKLRNAFNNIHEIGRAHV